MRVDFSTIAIPPHPPLPSIATIPQGSGITSHTDGSCVGNPGPAGSSVVLSQGGRLIGAQGFQIGIATNNVAELMGAVHTLRWAHGRSDLRLIIVTDSEYLRNGITTWIATWRRNGWRTSTGQPVSNKDVWEELHARTTAFPFLRWQWTRGHVGNEFNEVADIMAGLAARGRIG